MGKNEEQSLQVDQILVGRKNTVETDFPVGTMICHIRMHALEDITLISLRYTRNHVCISPSLSHKYTRWQCAGVYSHRQVLR